MTKCNKTKENNECFETVFNCTCRNSKLSQSLEFIYALFFFFILYLETIQDILPFDLFNIYRIALFL